MATIDGGDANCSSGLSKAIFDKLIADSRNGFRAGYYVPADVSSAPEMRALVAATAQGTADTINAAGGVGGGGGSTAGLYWAKPTTPNSRDEEFENAALPGWTLDPQANGTTILGTVDPVLNFTSPGHPAVRADCNTRLSCLRIQAARAAAPSESEPCPYGKSFAALTGDFVCWARIAGSFDGDGSIRNAMFGIYLRNTAAGQFVALYANKQNSNSAQGRSGATFSSSVTPNEVHPLLEWSLWAIQIRGGNAFFWVGTDAGMWRFVGEIGSIGIASFDQIQLSVGNYAANALPNPVISFDFVRFLETSQFPF